MEKLFISLIFTLGIGTAFAGSTQTYDCKHSTGSIAGRKVELNYLAEGKQVPCNVVYTKGDVSETKFNATHEVGYCEKSLDSFLGTLKNIGWTCQKAGAATVETHTTAPATEQAPTAPASHEATVQETPAP